MKHFKLNEFEIYEIPPPLPTNKAIFFGHANGIPALTYKTFLEKIAKEINCHVFTYDIRGFGRSKLPTLTPNKQHVWFWDILSQDHAQLFLAIKAKLPQNTEWILCGHSLGAWLSILSLKSIHVKKLILMDPPILPPKVIIPWTFLHLIKKTHLSPISRKVKNRKTTFPSTEQAVSDLKKSSLMKLWPDECVKDYIDGSFIESQIKNNILLRHDPNWEGKIFEEYPIGAWRGFIEIPKHIRKEIEPCILVGEKSDTCNINAESWVRLFFPKLKWIKINNGSHMFPIELQDITVAHLKQIII